jgi:methylated-DNA-[protein]-cysteine S-methyltransferase
MAGERETTARAYIETPLGVVEFMASGEALARLDFRGCRPPKRSQWTPFLRAAAAQLEEYFAGTRIAFDLPLALGGTEFQRRVWNALLEVGYGETTTYGALARRLGSPAAVRAVGAANGANPVSIVVPCHRIVGADGRLTGYGGGLWRKEWLLAHERKQAGPSGPLFRRPA